MQIVEDKLEQIQLQPEINNKETLPESCSDETVVISTKAESLNHTFVLKQKLDLASDKRQTPTTHRSKPPIDTRCLTKLITKPAIQKKRLIINNHKLGLNNRKMNQENMPLIMAATRTLANQTLTKAVILTRSKTNNILTAKSGKKIYNK